MQDFLRRFVLAGAASALALVTNAAHADDPPDCASLPKPFYGLGGSASKPYIGKLAVAFAKAADPQTLVYQAPGACVGVNGILTDGTTITGTASYWDKDSGKELTCNLSVAGDPVQFANSGNFATSCPGVTALPDGVVDVEGPIQPYDLIVPVGSSEQSISAEAAYYVFGLGAAGNVAPWTDETALAVRDQNSAAQLFISLAIGVPATQFKGVNTKSNSGTVTAVATATNVNAALGLVSGEVADANADTVRILAFQAKGQTCGYTPDQNPKDKLNVRTGQYDIWGQQHFLAHASGGVVTPDAVKQLFDAVSNAADLPDGSKNLAAAIAAGAIPSCAMEVQRSADLGDVSSYAPAEPCGCFFDFTATGATDCQACTGDADCPSSATHCRSGFCEVN